MYIIRCLFVALLVALASAKYQDEKQDYYGCTCIIPGPMLGVKARDGECPPEYTFCGYDSEGNACCIKY